MAAEIRAVTAGSPASKLPVSVGDTLVCVNGHAVKDVLDYLFYTADENCLLELARPDGSTYTVQASNAPGEPLGLEFDTYLMDHKRPCANRCVFCFVDQNPPGMRESVYFKDDDARLSFLQGNYITLTNLSPREMERLCQLRISPLRVSVHATDPAVRVRLMGNPKAGELMERLRTLTQGGIEVHAQLVLCPGWNDGEELTRSLTDLYSLGENLASVAAVPVGLTAHREGLAPLAGFDEASARDVLRRLRPFQRLAKRERGVHWVYGADEFYRKLGKRLPPVSHYDGFCQLDNGVGLLRYMELELAEALAELPKKRVRRRITVATGLCALPYVRAWTKAVCRRFPGLKANVVGVPNLFFGGGVDVAGLLTGSDLVSALSGLELGDALCFPASMLRAQGDLFLDDKDPAWLEAQLGVPAVAVPNDGAGFIRALIGEE